MVDIARHVARYRFTPPAGFGGLSAFNRALADEILADPSPEPPLRDGIDINYFPRTNHSPAFVALHDFIKASMTAYVDALPRMGLDTVLPPLPQAALYATGNVVLRDDGRNGEHIHGRGYLSAVYHVQVPRSVTEANDHRGGLVLGCCEAITGGYAPVWGARVLKPEAGWVTIIPSHMFHDVMPPLTAEARVSVVADLRPVWD